MHGVPNFVTDCLGVYSSTSPEGVQASDQPQGAGRAVMFLSLLSLCNAALAICFASIVPTRVNLCCILELAKHDLHLLSASSRSQMVYEGVS